MSVGYNDLEEALNRLGLDQGASEFHGTVCGRLCAAHERHSASKLGRSGQSDDDEALLGQVKDEALNGLMDAELGFSLLLPDDDAPLARRVEALGQWCAGFVYGLATVEDVELDELSEEVQEVVRDLTQISRAGLTPDADTEADEEAYAEVVEYVRIGAQLIFMEIARRRGRSEGPTESGRLH